MLNRSREHRAEAAGSVPGLELDQIQRMGREELLKLRNGLGMLGTWNMFEVPSAWLPPGGAQSLARLHVRARLASHTSSRHDIELAMLYANRFLILCFVSVQTSRRGAQLLSMTTVMRSVEEFITLLRAALQRPKSDPQRLFDRLMPEDLLHRDCRKQAARVMQLVARGLWSDGLSAQADFSIEHGRRGKTLPLEPERRASPFLPLPDEFVAEAGWRLTWIMRELAPCLLNFADDCAQIFETQDRLLREWKCRPPKHRRRSNRPVAASSLIKRRIIEMSWCASDGKPLEQAPDALLLPDGSSVVDWPPKSYSQVKLLLHLLQFGHLFVFLLSSGGRISEALSLQDGCIVENTDGVYTADGRTYKLVFDREGATRDWPLPDVALQAIRQQERLSRSLAVIGNVDHVKPVKRRQTPSQSIWKSIGRQGASYKGSYNHGLRRAINVLGLDRWLDDASLSTHRFRKTIARLIALAMVDAPKILMDLFGHKTIEMTLHYILTDPGLRSEMAEVAKAQVILNAKKFLDDAEGLGGAAARTVRQALAHERARIGRDFREEDLTRLAETFTFSGRYWQLVRPGVLCTKGPQQLGPCTKALGIPEPSRCRSECIHRLEDGFLREDTDRCIADGLAYLEAAEQADDEIGAEMWRGQVLAHLPRFPDLDAKWRQHPVVARIAAVR